MKSILISIKPEWVAKILNGEKTIEIRKTAPKCELPIDVYIYCTKEKSYLAYERHVQEYIICDTIEKLGEHGNEVSPTDTMCALQDWGVATNGHIVARFTLREVEEIIYIPCSLGLDERRKHGCYSCVFEDSNKPNFNKENYSDYFTKGSDDNYLVDCSKMKASQIHAYLKGKGGYAWHISDLEIFDEPKKLSDFGLKRAPQSWCYVEEED